MPDLTGNKQGRWQKVTSGNPLAEDFIQHGAAVIEWVRRERPQDYLKVAVSLTPKQTETEERQGRPLEEYTDDELIDIMANGLEEAVEQVLAARGYDRLTQEERQQLANL